MSLLVLKNCALGIFFPPPRNLDLLLEAAFPLRNGCKVGRLYLQVFMSYMAESIHQFMQFVAEYRSGSHSGLLYCNQLADVCLRGMGIPAKLNARSGETEQHSGMIQARALGFE